MEAAGQPVFLSTSCVPRSARGLLGFKLAPTHHPSRLPRGLLKGSPLPAAPSRTRPPSGALLLPRCLSLAFEALLSLASTLDSGLRPIRCPYMTFPIRAREWG